MPALPGLPVEKERERSACGAAVPVGQGHISIEFRISAPGLIRVNCGLMKLAKYRVRRATLDDIGPLTGLWQSMNFPVEELARRITEFQVAESAEGVVLGGVGLQIVERQGRIHSEGFTDFALAEHLRPMLWERLNTLAANQGLLRLWTQESAPFWNHCGLIGAGPEATEQLPAVWRSLPPGWRTLKLREDLEQLISADKEFALFMESERARTQQVLRHGHIVKLVATLIALAVFVPILVWVLYLALRHPQLLRR
jgi:N-acetylglutamate synthase-like GNAT family acetyltransferase